jgi:hypothetical protein
LKPKIPPKKNETAASILERDLDLTIEHWLALVLNEKELTGVPLSVDARTNHLPRLIRDLVDRLRSDTQIAATSWESAAAWRVRAERRWLF